MPCRNLATVVGIAFAAAIGIEPVALAVIENPIPLAKMIASDQILLAKVSRWDPERPAMVLTVERSLKGGLPFEKLNVVLKGDKEAETKQLQERLAAEKPVVVFVTDRGPSYVGLAFTNGTWFQLVGEKSATNIVWRFTHIEPYLRKTYKGTTAELTKTLDDVLAGKAKAPPLDTKEKPGLGPTLAEAEGK